MCGPVRSGAARVHLSPCAPQIILRVSRFNLRLYHRVGTIAAPTIATVANTSAQLKWVRVASLSRAGLDRVSTHACQSPIDHTRLRIDHSGPTQRAPGFLRTEMIFNFAASQCHREIERVMPLSFGVDTARIKRSINLFARGRPIRAIKRSMPLTLSLTYRNADRTLQFTRNDQELILALRQIYLYLAAYRWCNNLGTGATD